MTESENRLYEEYLELEKIQGSAIKTIRVYRSRLKKFLQYLEEKSFALGELRVKHAEEFQRRLGLRAGEHGSKYKSNTIRSTITAAGRFCRFLKSKGIMEANPFAEVRLIRKEKKIPQNLLKEAQMMKFLKTLEQWGKNSRLTQAKRRYRVHVICELLYSTGMRIGEAASLELDDIDFEKGLVRIRKGKGGRSRVVFLNEYAKEVLQHYVADMRELLMGKERRSRDRRVFGAGMDYLDHLVNEVVKKVAEECGYDEFTSHAFRHCVGYHLLKAGCDIRYIQALLGHEKLGTTEIYTKVDKEDLKEVLDRYHPRKLERKS